MDNKAANSEKKLYTKMYYFVMNSIHSCSYRNRKKGIIQGYLYYLQELSQFSVKCQLPHALKLLKFNIQLKNNHTTNL